MSDHEPTVSTDLIRWTFTVPEAAVAAVCTHLSDLGADVFLAEDQTFHVTWDEPTIDLDPVVEAVWELAGAPFEIAQEEFHRLALHILQHEPDAAQHHETDYHPGFDPLEPMDL